MNTIELKQSTMTTNIETLDICTKYHVFKTIDTFVTKYGNESIISKYVRMIIGEGRAIYEGVMKIEYTKPEHEMAQFEKFRSDVRLRYSDLIAEDYEEFLASQIYDWAIDDFNEVMEGHRSRWLEKMYRPISKDEILSFDEEALDFYFSDQWSFDCHIWNRHLHHDVSRFFQLHQVHRELYYCNWRNKISLVHEEFLIVQVIPIEDITVDALKSINKMNSLSFSFYHLASIW
jgi:hypothetical protein